MSRKRIILEEVDIFDKLEDHFSTVTEFIEALKALECELVAKHVGSDVSVNLSDTPYGDYLYLEVSKYETDEEMARREEEEAHRELVRIRRAEEYKRLKSLYNKGQLELQELSRRMKEYSKVGSRNGY